LAVRKFSNFTFIRPEESKGHGCGVKFGVEIQFLGLSDLFKANCPDVAIYADGHMELNELLIDLEKVKIPCGWITFDGFGGGIRKNNGTAYVVAGTRDKDGNPYTIKSEWVSQAKTWITFSSVPKKTFCLEVQVFHALPPDLDSGIILVGTVKLLDQPIAKLGARLTKDEISGFIDFPAPESAIASTIEKVLEAHAQFRIDSNGLTSNGMFKLLSAVEAQCDLALNFNGSGHLYATQKTRSAARSESTRACFWNSTEPSRTSTWKPISTPTSI